MMPDYNNKQTRSYDRDRLPYSENAEKYLIGAMMLSPEALAKISSSLRIEDFYLSKHQTIYRAILSIPLDPDKRTKNVDMQVTAERLEEMQKLEEIGGSDYLDECADSYISPSTLDFNIESVNNKAVLRQMIETMRDIDYEIATEDIDNIPKYIGECESRFKSSISRRKVSSFEKTGLITEEVRQQIEMLSERGTGNEEEDAVVGVTTGFKKLNAITSGFKNGEVTIVGARPSVGKTALALNFAYNAARSGKSVAFFSLEMNKVELVKRLVSSVSFVNLSSFNTPRYLTRDDRVRLRQGLDEVAQSPIYIDDTPGITMIDIENKLRLLKESDPNLGLVIIDYLNLIGGSSDRKVESRQEEVRQNSLAIKNLARSLDLPIVLLSQLNRGVDERGKNHKPQLSDLRESGAIEQDADVVMLIYRADYYRDTKVDTNKKRSDMTNEEIFMASQEERRKTSDNTSGGADDSTSYVEVDVCKNRNGPTGVVSLFFYKNIQRFETPNQEWDDLVKRYRSEGYPTEG